MKVNDLQGIKNKIDNSSNAEERKEWQKLYDRLEKNPNYFAYEYVSVVKQKCGHYEILQSPHEKSLLDGTHIARQCTRCVLDL